nr:MAG TPA: hypothetical protein [Caudoviricetes sp.]
MSVIYSWFTNDIFTEKYSASGMLMIYSQDINCFSMIY